MNLSYLRLFNTLASELNFSKAANALYISQPALSMQIKKLEEDLGFKLFDRSCKHLCLTENGKLLYQYTKKIFALVDEVEVILSSKNDNIRGVVEIGASNAPGTYILPAVLGEFRNMYPDVITNLHISSTSEIERMVLDNRIDFAINGGEVNLNSKLHVEKLAEDELVFICSPANVLANRRGLKREELLEQKFIVHEKSSRLYDLIENIAEEIGLPDNIGLMLGHIDAIKQAVELDLGISAIPASTVKAELKHGLLKQFTIMDKKWYYPYNLVYMNERHQSIAAKKLMELICARVGSKPLNLEQQENHK